MGTPYTFNLGMSCHSTRIELFYFDDNFRRIAQWFPPFSGNNHAYNPSISYMNYHPGSILIDTYAQLLKMRPTGLHCNVDTAAPHAE